MKRRTDRIVEPAHAFEAGRERDFGNWKRRLIQQAAREVDAVRALKRSGRGADVLREKPPQVPRAESEAFRKSFHGFVPVAVENPFQRARNRRGRPVPHGRTGRSLRPAPPTRAESGIFRGRGVRVKAHVLRFRERRGAAGPAIDVRRHDADEEPARKAGVPAQNGLYAGGVLEVHAGNLLPGRWKTSRFRTWLFTLLVPGGERGIQGAGGSGGTGESGRSAAGAPPRPMRSAIGTCAARTSATSSGTGRPHSSAPRVT